MVEHLVCNQAVVGSNPVASTTRTALMIDMITRHLREVRLVQQGPN